MKPILKRKSDGSLLVFVITVLLLLPAVYTTFECRTIDESCFQSLIRYLFRNLGHGKLGGVSLMREFGAPYAYGWIYWVVTGLPTKLFNLMGITRMGILWPRLLSTIFYGASLALLWKIMCRAKIPLIARLGPILIIGFTPSLIYNAIRMHPDIIVFMTLILGYHFLIEDEGSMGKKFYIGVLFWGISVGIKLSAVFSGLAIFSYLLYFYKQDENITAKKIKQIVMKSIFFAVLGFIISNPTFLLPRHLKDYIDSIKYLSLHNSDKITPGLSWATWFHTFDKFFVWLPAFFTIVAFGCFSAYFDYKNKSLRPYALIGLAGFWGSFWATALLVLKTPVWHHYLLPAYSAFPFIIIGGLVWLLRNLKPKFYWIILVVFISFASIRISVASHMWYIYAVEGANPFQSAKVSK